MEATFIYAVYYSKVYPDGSIRGFSKIFDDFQKALSWYNLKSQGFCVRSCSLTLNVHIGGIHVAEKLL